MSIFFLTIYSMTNYLLMLWEEKNLIKQKMNYLNNKEIVQKDIIKDTNKDSTKSQCRNIGKISGIYKIVNKIDGKYYVGSSKHIYKRWNTHIRSLNNNYHTNDYLQNAWKKYGSNAFEFTIVEVTNCEETFLIEQKYLDIAKLEQDKCYNLNFESKGGCVNDYTKEKMRIIKIDYYKNQENRKKISLKLKGIPLSDETKQKMSLSRTGEKHFRYGKKLTLEHKNKLSESHMGIKNPWSDKNIYTCYNELSKIKVSGTRYELSKLMNLTQDTTNYLIRKQTKKTRCGWVLIDHS